MIGKISKAKLLSSVKHDLDGIEKALKENLTPYLDLVSDVAGHLLFGGGKRLRPLLMILSARACGYDGNEDKLFSIIFEYLHAATLLHDDIIDGGVVRRGKPAAHTIWDPAVTVLTGDFLLARSLSLSAKTKNPKIISIIAEITENMSQGEIHQLSKKGDLTLTEDEYMDIIKNKTSVLIQGACRTGALIAGADGKEEAALSDYGLHLGLAFQMIDDLLDYTSRTETLGKAVGTDLKEGKLTLPVIYTLGKASQNDRDLIRESIEKDDLSDEDLDIFIKLLQKYGGLNYTEQIAAEHVEKAKRALDLFQPSKSKDILSDIADYALSRKL
ncbi:MAG: polyprenyl synthetase family protein [Desulfobacterales bacterium]|nr:polyprenyl synthetase family protein [Desulfobacterales bacterium]